MCGELLGRLPVENVEFIGSLPQGELIERMGRSHVLMLPSIEEGLALVQAQAMACELPVIATEATGSGGSVYGWGGRVHFEGQGCAWARRAAAGTGG